LIAELAVDPQGLPADTDGLVMLAQSGMIVGSPGFMPHPIRCTQHPGAAHTAARPGVRHAAIRQQSCFIKPGQRAAGSIGRSARAGGASGTRLCARPGPGQEPARTGGPTRRRRRPIGRTAAALPRATRMTQAEK
jgi:hypothetical protein